MDRRDFLKQGSAIVVSLGLGNATSVAATNSPETSFRGPYSTENTKAGPSDLSLRFLGTGAAGYYQDQTRRRHSSILLDKKVLIDLNRCSLDMLPRRCHPEVLFYTHSHPDHYEPDTALDLNVRKIYLSETWIDKARKDFEKYAAEKKKDMPQLIPLAVGQKVEEGGLVVTALPANHATGNYKEQSLIYLIEKGTTDEHLGVRLLYATDTGGIMGNAGRIAGIDPHLKTGRPVTAFIMEATIGMGMNEDWRMFNHTSVEGVARIAHMMEQQHRYLPSEGQPVYITHMSKKGWPTQEELDRTLPLPLRAAFDGLDVVFKSHS